MKYLVALAILAAAPAFAATGTDPEWPCIQRKQPHLSLGQVWTGPVPDDRIAELARDPQIDALAARLEQRRLPIEEAEAAIADFAAGADDARLTALMVAIFNKIEPDRSALIDGIARYGRSQVSLSQRIEERRAQMAELEAAADPDFDAIDAAEEALDWDQRIFTERQQSLTYVCETPVILEQRAFALGRAIAGHLGD
ncbi:MULTISPECIES: hypothetical protein [Paracoccus]|uniref:Uncharacterized protein n=1 Tax=Paracoccus aerius TaxID=1915382 RepID=A0ABS1S036_9RHOB|nr:MULTISPECIES: hypothetical protein [Paracoccus]MBL3672064.1 hypothetical protein [Paracoccus aerius]QIR86168.1 hypothetical protein FIU66_13655 [Paracoccus sp. AK26]GHG13056.1 hypothetical protein GCM10017322_06100 [Paracoccus aerius]